MSFRQLVFNNVLRNKRLYAGYFLSSAFSVMLFFVYSMLAFHPNLNLEKSGTLGSGAQTGMYFAQFIIYVFTFFFILYSMGILLKTRKKEFGIMTMFGMTNMQLKFLAFLENLLIGFASTISGIAAGLVLSQGILALGSKLLDIDYSLGFYWPLKAIGVTFFSFMALFLFISFFTAAILKNSSIISLLKGTAKPNPDPAVSPFLTVLAVVLLIGGYTAALLVRGIMVLAAMIPVTIAVIIATYLLFSQLSVFLIKLSKKKKQFYWKKTNLITLSDLAYRLRDNARMFFIVTIVSTVACIAIGTLVGLRSLLLQMAEDKPEAAIQYESPAGGSHQQNDIQMIERLLNKEKIHYEKTIMSIKNETDVSTSNKLTILKASDYNKVIESHKQSIDLAGSQAVFLFNKGMSAAKKSEWTLEESQKKIHVIQSQAVPAPLLKFTGYNGALIVSDDLYAQLGNGEKERKVYAYDIADWKQTEKVSKEIQHKLESFLKDDAYHFQAKVLYFNEIKQQLGHVLFAGLFIGAVFFAAAGSFLYFRIYTDFENDRAQLQALEKLGLTEQEMSNIITTKLMLLFFVPIGVALTHGAVAFTALEHVFEAAGVSLIKESAFVLGAFLLIQCMYFLFIRFQYLKQLKNAIYHDGGVSK